MKHAIKYLIIKPWPTKYYSIDRLLKTFVKNRLLKTC